MQTTTAAKRRAPGRGTLRGRRTARVAAAIALAGTGLVAAPGTAAADGPPPILSGYVPLPADSFQAALDGIDPAASNNLLTVVSVANAGTDAVVYLDHWEDGFEADVSTPAQGTTLVFGDGDTTNGSAAPYCASCADDTLDPGDVLVFRNTITTPRDPGQIRFDGSDRVSSTRGFTIGLGGWADPPGTVFAGAVGAYDTSRYGTRFVAPVGVDTPVPAGTTPAFEWVGMSVMAAEDGTTVTVDRDADGTVDLTDTIDAGEDVFVGGDVRAGALVTTSAPAQAHLLTGDRVVGGSQYESRFYELFPTQYAASDYVSPAGTAATGTDPANQANIVYFHNGGDAPIAIDPQCAVAACDTTVTVGAGGGATFVQPPGQAVRYQGTGPFQAVAAIGAHSGVGPSADESAYYDWGHTLVPTPLLTSQVVLGWAPGNSNSPVTGTATNVRSNPVWVGALGATTLQVTYDGRYDCDAPADATVAVGAFAATRITDPNDFDMTGARVYTCDGTRIAGAWGQDPLTAPNVAPGLDAGYTIVPSTTVVVDKSAAVVTDVGGDGRFGPGDTVEFAISIADAGSLALTDVVVEDTFGPGLSYVPGTSTLDAGGTTTPIDDRDPPAAPFPFSGDGQAIPDLQPGEEVVVRYRATIDTDFSGPASSITNAATVTAAGAEGFDTFTTELVESDLSLTKEATDGAAFLGEDATFRVTVANAGPDAAAGIEVTDELPAGATLVSDTSSQGAYDPSTGVWDVGTLAPGASATLDLVVRTSASPVVNTAEISACNCVDPDSVPGDDDPDQDDRDDATVTAAGTAIGGDVWYDADGDGQRDAGEPGLAGVDVTATWLGADGVPGGGDDVPFPATTGPTGSWSVADAPAGTYVVAVDDATLPAGLATATGDPDDDDPDAVATPGQAVVTVVGGTARDDVDFGYRGTNIVGDLVFHDVDGDGAYDPGEPGLGGVPVTVTWYGPDGVAGGGDDAVLTATTAPDGGWLVPGLPPGAVRVDVDGSALAAAGFTAVTADPDGGGDASTVLTLTAGVDRSADFGFAGTAAIGDTVFRDADGDGAPDPGEGLAGVTVSVTWYGADGTAGTGDDVVYTTVTDADGTWRVGNLPDGTFAVEVVGTSLPGGLVGTVDPDGAADDRAVVTIAGGADRLDQDFGYRGQADLALTKTAAPATFRTGQPGTFLLSVSNAGPYDAVGTASAPIRVTDTVPAALPLVSATGDGWDCSATSGQDVSCDLVGTVAAGGPAPAPVVVTVDVPVAAEAGATNTAEVGGGTAPDPVPGNDTDDATVAVTPQADLSLEKQVVGDVVVGETATFRLTVANDGPSTAAGPLTVVDTLPGGLTYSSSSSDDAWTCDADGDEVTCTLADGLPAGATSTLDLVVDVGAEVGDTVENVATVSSPTADPDPSDDASTSAPPTVPTVDLTVTKAAVGAFQVGAAGAYDLVVSNRGPSTAPAGTTLRDPVPAGLTVTGVEADGAWTCSTDAGELTCTLGATLAAGASAPPVRLLVEVGATAHPSVGNTATVSAPTGAVEAEPGDDAATATTPVAPLADLAVAKSHTGPVAAGGDVTFDVDVRNDGPNPHPGPVTLTDTLPAGLTFASASGDGWTCETTGQVVACERADGLAVGTSSRLSITAAVDVALSGPVANTAVVTSPVADPDPTNDTATDEVDVARLVDLALTASLVSERVVAGGQATWSLVVTNQGGALDSPVTVAATLPTGLTFVSATGEGWTCGAAGQVVTCDRDGLAAGATSAVTLVTEVTATAGASLTLEAVASTDGADAVPADNTGEVGDVTVEADPDPTPTDPEPTPTDPEPEPTDPEPTPTDPAPTPTPVPAPAPGGGVPSVADGTATPARRGPLARTGADHGATLQLGLVLIVLGALAVGTSRRRRPALGRTEARTTWNGGNR